MWVVVATSALALFFSGAPIVVYSFSVFLKPLSQEFQAGRGAISLAFTIHNFIAAFSAPVIGWLVDRYGARKVLIPGLALLALVLISGLTIGSNLWQLYPTRLEHRMKRNAKTAASKRALSKLFQFVANRVCGERQICV